MFSKVLIANRGAIACRVMRTLRRMGIHSVAVYSEADAGSLHVDLADEAILIGPGPAAQSYLVAEKILEAARETGAQAIHPGYGFLSENPAFAEACAGAGIAFIGPKPDQMRRFGLKHTARAIAEQQNVPLLPGTSLLANFADARAAAACIGYPVMLKSTAGGGGIGMQLCWNPAELEPAFARVDRLSRANFKESGLYLEKYVQRARHIEVQIFGDGRGHVVALGERDAQRIDATTSTSFACDLKKWLQIMQTYENGGHAYHATLPTDALLRTRDVMRETQRAGFERLCQAQWKLGGAVRAMLERRGFPPVAAPGFQAPGVVVSYTTDPELHTGRKLLAQGVQIAGGVPLQCGEGPEFKTFRIGLFGLDKLQDVDGAVQRLERAFDAALA